MKLIDTQHSKLLAKALDTYNIRQKAIASNISNIDTPGYKRLEVSFEEKLQQAQEVGINKDLSKVDAEVKQTEEQPVLENEMMELADNQIRVQAVTKSIRHSFGLLRNAIRGRT